jgi:steroid delta-isomerase-like uncharacterized protein
MSDAIGIVQKFFDALNARDVSRAEALLHPDFTNSGPDGLVAVRGPKEMSAFLGMYFAAFPDFHDEVLHFHAAGDNIVVAEVIVSGTHRGDLMGIPPTGRKVAQPVCNVWEVRDGKVFSEREYYDPAVMLEQLGVVPVPPAG